jgi:hypothetical protein
VLKQDREFLEQLYTLAASYQGGQEYDKQQEAKRKEANEAFYAKYPQFKPKD